MSDRRATMVIGLIAGLLLCAPGGLARAQTPPGAQVTAADYDRAAAVLDGTLRGKLRNAGVDPHWIGSRDIFWYRRDTAAGSEYQVVDARTGHGTRAFDPAPLAAAASKALNAPVKPDALAITAIDADPDPRRVTLTIVGQDIDCALPAYACVKAPRPPSGGPDALPSPDGSRALFARNDDLWLRDLKTGAEHRLTTDGAAYFSYGKLPDSSLVTLPRLRAGAAMAPVGVSWSPDGETLVGVRLDERAIAPYPYVEWAPQNGGYRPVTYQIRLSLLGDPPPPQEPFVIDLESGRKVAIHLPDGWSYQDPAIAWSADGRHVYGLAATPGERDGALVEVDVRTGAARLVVKASSPTRVDFSPFVYDGPNVRILGGGREALWWSERDGWGHLYLYDIATGRLERQLTSGPWLVRDVIAVDEAHRQVYFAATGREPGVDPYYRRLYRVSLDGGPVTDLTPQDGDHDFSAPPPPALAALLGEGAPSQKISPGGRYFVDTASTVDQAPVTVLRDTSSGAAVATLETADASAVVAAGWRAPRRTLVKAADGTTDIAAVVYFPAGYTPSGRYPVIDAFYGGPQMINAPRDFPEAIAALNPISRSSLAQLGFIVVTIDGRGTPGRSRAFHDVGYGDWADPQIADHIAAIRQLAARYGGFDLDRVGVYGHSFGGYTSARALLSHPEFYKVAVSSAGPQNYQGFYDGLEPYNGLPDYGGGATLRPSPQAVPERYRMLDNASLAKNLRGHLMLVYGDMDENALPAVTLQLADALEKADKSFDLLYLPNRTHGFFRTDHYYTRRMWDYFIEHLAGREPPENYDLKPATP